MTWYYRLTSLVNFLLPSFVTRISGEVKGRTIVLDNRVVDGAVLRECHLVIGNGLISVYNTRMVNCSYQAYGGAASGLTFLDFLGSQMPEIVQATLKSADLKSYYAQLLEPEIQARIKAEVERAIGVLPNPSSTQSVDSVPSVSIISPRDVP